MTKRKQPKVPDTEPKSITVHAEKGESEPRTMSRVMLEPYLRHGIVTKAISDKMMGKLPGEPAFDDFAHVIKAKAEITAKGNMTLPSEILTAQAMTLDSIFTEFARRSAMNMGDYIDASKRYMRLALKAQANSRATLEALAKLHQPREQTVKHVHVNEGGQAVVADHFHQNTGGQENAKTNEQPYATEIGAAGTSPSLPSPDPLGNGMPIPSRAGQAAMQDARRD